MGPAGDICRRLRDPKNLSNPKDSKFLLMRLLRAMWRPLRAKKRVFNHF